MELDPQTEILPLIGSKEGIAHAPLALANPGDVVLIPDPGYPPYRSGALFAGAEPVAMPLLEENHFLPDLGGISQKAARRAKLLFLNYPNNPTAALATADCYAEAVALARDYGILIAQDAAYSEMCFDGERPVSFLSVPGAKEVGVEFHSLSKTYCMTGWRIGWALGPKPLVNACAALNSHSTQNPTTFAQVGAVEALVGPQKAVQELAAEYRRRRDFLYPAIAALPRVTCVKPAGAFYLFPNLGRYLTSKIPTTLELGRRLLDETGVAVVPGEGFGAPGYVRISFARPLEELKDGAERIAAFLAAL